MIVADRRTCPGGRPAGTGVAAAAPELNAEVRVAAGNQAGQDGARLGTTAAEDSGPDPPVRSPIRENDPVDPTAELADLRREVQGLQAENARLSRLLELRGQGTAPPPEQLSAPVAVPGMVTMTGIERVSTIG